MRHSLALIPTSPSIYMHDRTGPCIPRLDQANLQQNREEAWRVEHLSSTKPDYWLDAWEDAGGGYGCSCIVVVEIDQSWWPAIEIGRIIAYLFESIVLCITSKVLTNKSDRSKRRWYSGSRLLPWLEGRESVCFLPFWEFSISISFHWPFSLFGGIGLYEKEML